MSGTDRLDDMDRPDLLRFVASIFDQQADDALAEDTGDLAGMTIRGFSAGYRSAAQTLRAIADEMVAPPLPVRTMMIAPDVDLAALDLTPEGLAMARSLQMYPGYYLLTTPDDTPDVTP